MQYPYRIKIHFGENSKKLNVIMNINNFILYSSKGKIEKWNIHREYTFVGIELAMESHEDAVLFKLGFNSDQEKIESVSFA